VPKFVVSARLATRVAAQALLAGVMLAAPTAWAFTSVLGEVPLAELPVEGRRTYDRILSGGPFPFEKDGVVFGNRERLLPGHKRGYYLEYTVRTPGVSHRGGRRIVCGGRQPRLPDACYYTADHYGSFRRIVE